MHAECRGRWSADANHRSQDANKPARRDKTERRRRRRRPRPRDTDGGGGAVSDSFAFYENNLQNGNSFRPRLFVLRGRETARCAMRARCIR